MPFKELSAFQISPGNLLAALVWILLGPVSNALFAGCQSTTDGIVWRGNRPSFGGSLGDPKLSLHPLRKRLRQYQLGRT